MSPMPVFGPARAFSGVPRGWVLIGAALAAWLVFAALGAVMVQILAGISAQF
jgi:hypothetical protein